MKIAHIADTHIGYENHGFIDKTSGLHTRFLDFLQTFDYLVEDIINKDVDLVVFAGDAFKNRDPNMTHQREFAKRLFRLIKAEIPIVFVSGNHDRPANEIKATSMDVFGELMENINLFKKPDAMVVKTKNGEIVVAGIPYLTKSQVLKEGYKNNDINQAMQELYKYYITEVNQKSEELSKANGNIPAILVGHLAVQGATVGRDTVLTFGNDLVLPLNLFNNLCFNYIALGHLHKHQSFLTNNNTPVVYCGSMDRIDFNEEFDRKGYVLIDIDKNQKIEWKFIELPVRPFKTFEFDLVNNTETEYVLNIIMNEEIRDAIVRFRVKAKPENYITIDWERIYLELNKKGVFYFSNIEKEWVVENKDKTEYLTGTETDFEMILKAKEYYQDNGGRNVFVDDNILLSCFLSLSEEVEGVF